VICAFPKLEQFYAGDTSMDDATMDRIEAYTDTNAETRLDR
jgi:hypothetical protein